VEPLTFAAGVLAGDASVKGFEVVATDGRAGRVSWASYKPGESYLVVTVGLLSRKHHVVPAGAVTSVGDGEVRVGLTRAQIEQLPDLPHPEPPVDEKTFAQTWAAAEKWASLPRN
jgi:hypothetical protein